MKCLSIRPPWSTLIIIGIKPVENRSWCSNFRGRLLIHSSKTWDKDGAEWICAHFPALNGLIKHSVHLRGYIIGAVDMVDCVKEYLSEWFCGPYGFVFRNQFELDHEDTILYRGQLGIFEVPETVFYNQSPHLTAKLRGK